jgi:hypothetical protein
MNQKKRILKVLVVTGIIAILATAGIAAFAFQGASNADGQITVSMPTTVASLPSARLAELQARIAHANNLINTVDRVAGGSASHWAPAPHHDNLEAAVAEASALRGVAASSPRVFDITANIAGNVQGVNGGFSGMTLRLELPPGLALVGAIPGPAFREPVSFQGGPGWNADTFAINPPRTGDVAVGWSGTLGVGDTPVNFTGNGTLVTFRVQVTTATGTTGPIRIGFGSNLAPYHDRPTRSLPGGTLQELSMSINGTNMAADYAPVSLGSITIQP